MRRILIDHEVQKRAEGYAGVMTDNQPKKVTWKEMPQQRLKDFFEYLWQHGRYDAGRYVYTIICYYKTILLLKPSEFKEIYTLWFKQWDNVLNEKIDYKGNSLEFYKHVIDCMRYKDIRSGLMRQYMKDQKIKACVYCNGQYAIATEVFVEDGQKKIIGTYHFDHFMPESKYPFLCTSYFNLQPSCPTCNITKSTRDAEFNLYTTDTNKQDVFWFELTPEKSLDAYVSEDMDKLEVKLNSNNATLLENHQKLFHIDEIYEQHIDVVQELIVKMRDFSDSNQQATMDSVAILFPNGVDDPERFFFGYYMDKEYVHYRPLSKLAQDVVSIFRQA